MTDRPEPRRPAHPGWKPVPAVAYKLMSWAQAEGIRIYAAEAWQYRGVLVISAVEEPVGDDGSGDLVLSWHLSVTEHGGRPGRRAMESVRRDFGMTEAEEDNHAPGMKLRDLWLPVDPARRVGCACKEVEQPIIEVAGHGDDAEPYVWRPGLLLPERT